MRLVPVEAPDTAILSTAEARARCNISSAVADATVDALVSAGTAMLDGHSGWLGRALITQTWQMILPGFYHDHRDCRPYYSPQYYIESLHHTAEGRGIRIPLPPLQSISSIKYYDTNGTLQTLDPANYRIVPGTFALVFPVYGQTWPATRVQADAVTIEFVCGYGDDGSDIPEPIRQAVALQTSFLSAVTRQNPYLTMDRVEGIGEKRYQANPGISAITNDAVKALTNNYRVVF